MDLMKLKNELTSSFLLMGDDVSMLADALAFAKAFLHTEYLDSHPDFLLVETSEKMMGVEAIAPIMQKGAFPPVVAEKSIILINEMNKLSIAAQNKLLLLLESNPYCFVIGLCYKDVLLDTVKSRMRKVIYKPLTKEAFLKENGLSHPQLHFFYYACEGNKKLLDTLLENKDLFLSIQRICNTPGKLYQLFDVLHLVKEKDKLAVSTDKVLIKAVIRAMQVFFMEQASEMYKQGKPSETNRYLSICGYLLDAENNCSKTNYSKDDFFMLIVLCVEQDRTEGNK